MRILIISYYFPKDAAIGAVRPYQFARLLPQHGITPWVLTVEPGFAEAWDERFIIEGVPEERIGDSFRGLVVSLGDLNELIAASS